MKIKKMKYISLTLFVILHILIVAANNKSLKNSDIEKEILSTDDITISKTKLKTELKAEEQIIKEIEQNDKIKQMNNQKEKKDSIMTLASFIIGIVLFITSIYLIFWNENRIVKETLLNDYIRQERGCTYSENGKTIEEVGENKVFIVNGPVTIIKEAEISELPLEVKTNRGYIAIIKTHFERFSKLKREETDEETKTMIIKKDLNDFRNWVNSENNNIRMSTQFYHGEAVIAGNYSFSLTHLENQIEVNQTPFLEENLHIYRPTEKDIPILEEYFKLENNASKILIKDPYIYIIKSNIKQDDNFKFNPETYEFLDTDLRMSIKFYYITKVETHFTAVGKLTSENESKIKKIVPYETSIRKAECELFCCCGNQEQGNHKIDLLYLRRMNKDQILFDLEHQSKANGWYWRFVGFVTHFSSIVCILYPLYSLMGHIPVLGLISGPILTCYAFIVSMISFLFIVSLTWICSRPVYSVILFGVILILFFICKTIKDHLKAQEDFKYNGYEYEYTFKNEKKFL